MKTIRAKISLIALAVTFLLCLVILGLALRAGGNYRELIASHCGLTAEIEFRYIEDALGVFGEQAKDLARLGGVYYRMSLRSVEMDRAEIIENMGFDYDFLGGGLWFEPYAVSPDRNRFCFYAYNEGGRIVFNEIFESASYDYHNQSWYISITEQLKAGRSVAWYGPYIDESGVLAPMMTVGAGIYADNIGLVGISTVDLRIDFMSDLIPDLMFTPGTSILAVHEETGTILNDHGSGAGGDTLDFSKLFDNGIKLTISIPERELYSDVNAMMKNVLIFVLIIVLASYTIIYVMLDRLLNRPIHSLAEKTKEIGRGNLNVVIEAGHEDEIGELGATINKMTSDLKLYIENLGKVTKENERIYAELEIAGKIQREMLPVFEMKDENRDVYAEMIPCREIGGDFYDVFLIGENSLCTVVADVSGKGVPAAIFMANAKTTIKTLAQMGFSPSEIFTKANRNLADGNKTRMFVTAFLGILNLASGEYTYVNAGHNAPMIMQGGRGFELLKTEPAIALAASGKAVYKENSVRLDYGDKLFIYTDGVTETFNAKNETFGEIRLQKALDEHKGKSLFEMTACIKKELDAFADGTPRHDDITMLSIS